MDDIARLAFLRWRVETGRVRQYFIRESVLDIVREESHA